MFGEAAFAAQAWPFTSVEPFAGERSPLAPAASAYRGGFPIGLSWPKYRRSASAPKELELGPCTPVTRHSSLPVAGSWLVISRSPEATSSTRFALCHTSGEAQEVPGFSCCTRHSSLPLCASKQTRKARSTLKHCTNTLPSCSAGELAVP